MKKTLLFSALFLFAFGSLGAQAKRYIFLEHFTNTRCGICASQNPGFFNLLNNYKNQYHHMSVHPAIPYSSCLLYQANTADNAQRANFYSINGTPTVVIHGLTKKSAAGVTAPILDAELNKLSPIEVKVTETGTAQRNVVIEVKTVGTRPGGNYKLYVAALEKELNYASPNGEKVHHNVFRDFLSAPDGDDITLAAQGSSVTKNYSINLSASWVESQMYILAWVQDLGNKEVLNSGTKFDVLSANDDLQSLGFSIYPNPVQDQLHLEWSPAMSSAAKISITNLLGKELHQQALKPGTSRFDMSVQHLQKGIYFVRLQSGKEKITRKWIKE
ncbi:MAG TPA: Omp28-related outer membrane protein [Saprospiraceae bacterium]|nr:Omp28-related outer membrane protein [Saprospiraceae bacterium]